MSELSLAPIGTDTHTCNKCGHSWTVMKGMVGGSCPNCGYNPSVTPTPAPAPEPPIIIRPPQTYTHTCLYCGHTWTTPKEMVGGACPKCGGNPSTGPRYEPLTPGCPEHGDEV